MAKLARAECRRVPPPPDRNKIRCYPFEVGATSRMMVESKFVWGGEVGRNVTTSLPFLVKLDVLNEHDDPMSDYAEIITISAVTTTICLREGFEDKCLGLWCVLRLWFRPHRIAFTPQPSL